MDLDANKPAKRLQKTKLTKDSRRTLTTIRRTIRKQRYRKDLKMVRLLRSFPKNEIVCVF